MKASVVDIDHGYRDFMKRMKTLSGKPGVKVGFLDGQKEERPEGGPTNIEIAIWAEFGTRTEPERSFMRSTFDENREKYRQLAEKFTLAIAHGKMDEHRALGLLGEIVATDIRKKILSDIPPPNAPSTLARKPGDRTLVGGRLETATKAAYQGGQLAGAVTYAVEDGGGEEK
jgi:hypothetical protein